MRRLRIPSDTVWRGPKRRPQATSQPTKRPNRLALEAPPSPIGTQFCYFASRASTEVLRRAEASAQITRASVCPRRVEEKQLEDPRLYAHSALALAGPLSRSLLDRSNSETKLCPCQRPAADKPAYARARTLYHPFATPQRPFAAKRRVACPSSTA